MFWSCLYILLETIIKPTFYQLQRVPKNINKYSTIIQPRPFLNNQSKYIIFKLNNIFASKIIKTANYKIPQDKFLNPINRKYLFNCKIRNEENFITYFTR